ncbi:EFR1 family ferrodoxin [Thermosipho sp. (in: thermotogales)]|uniref:EFR1 family ferrodoxin n=1 Tax=Thermosipho sp. (in: thermotogales) TaxID=1968895 RepID=UPI00257F0EFD|nr:EFR1 family ferrodoxin [Thermosipho sp. (in: thermotogales)]
MNLLILLSPVHSFDLPWPVYSWVKKINDCLGLNTAIVLVSAGGFIPENSAAHLKLKHLLLKKGCNILYEDMVTMPLNCFSGMKEQEIKEILRNLPNKIDDIVDNLLKEKRKVLKPTLKGLILSKFSIFEKIFSKLFAKGYKVNDNCNLCGFCIKNCPTNNISIKNGKVHFDFNCALCLRCIYGCPQGAIIQRMFPFMIIKDGYKLENYLNKFGGDLNGKED